MSNFAKYKANNEANMPVVGGFCPKFDRWADITAEV
jgi:hypothetical protein